MGTVNNTSSLGALLKGLTEMIWKVTSVLIAPPPTCFYSFICLLICLLLNPPESTNRLIRFLCIKPTCSLSFSLDSICGHVKRKKKAVGLSFTIKHLLLIEHKPNPSVFCLLLLNIYLFGQACLSCSLWDFSCSVWV